MTSTQTTGSAVTTCDGHECRHHREVLRLRRNLHDALGAGLAGILMRVDILPILIARDPATAEEVLRELRREAAAFMTEFRLLLSDRGPSELDGHDLESALHALAERLGRTELHIEVAVEPTVREIGEVAEAAAYWIAKEALTNVVKHARARKCGIRAWVNGGLWVEISDDGVGGTETTGKGMGLESMRERATEIGGWCEVLDTGTGVTVQAYLPSERRCVG
jgi:signal transduction histidine kinase